MLLTVQHGKMEEKTTTTTASLPIENESMMSRVQEVGGRGVSVICKPVDIHVIHTENSQFFFTNRLFKYSQCEWPTNLSDSFNLRDANFRACVCSSVLVKPPSIVEFYSSLPNIPIEIPFLEA